VDAAGHMSAVRQRCAARAAFGLTQDCSRDR
jgi:hypothetical protein